MLLKEFYLGMAMGLERVALLLNSQRLMSLADKLYGKVSK